MKIKQSESLINFIKNLYECGNMVFWLILIRLLYEIPYKLHCNWLNLNIFNVILFTYITETEQLCLGLLIRLSV